MTLFVALSAALVALGLAFVLPPLLRARQATAVTPRDEVNARIYREQLAELSAERARGAIGEEEYRRAVAELERRIVAESGSNEAGSARRPHAAAAIGVALLIPLLAALGYWRLGTPDALQPGATEAMAQPDKGQVEELVERLWERMHKTPGDADGWALLGRSLTTLGQHERAALAFAQAVKLTPGDAGLLADYADTLAASLGRRVAGEPLALAKRALQLDPQHLKALALAGTGELQAGNPAAAAGYWKRALALIPAESEFARQLQTGLEEAQRLSAVPGTRAVPTAPSAKSETATKAQGLSGTVSLDPKLAVAAAPGDTVFVIARPADGGRMPLAVARTTVAALPYKFSLDDSMAMAAGAKLSAQPEVVVVARVSKSGNPVPQKGDMEGLSAPVTPKASGLHIVITRVVD